MSKGEARGKNCSRERPGNSTLDVMKNIPKKNIMSRIVHDLFCAAYMCSLPGKAYRLDQKNLAYRKIIKYCRQDDFRKREKDGGLLNVCKRFQPGWIHHPSSSARTDESN